MTRRGFPIVMALLLAAPAAVADEAGALAALDRALERVAAAGDAVVRDDRPLVTFRLEVAKDEAAAATAALAPPPDETAGGRSVDRALGRLARFEERLAKVVETLEDPATDARRTVRRLRAAGRAGERARRRVEGLLDPVFTLRVRGAPGGQVRAGRTVRLTFRPGPDCDEDPVVTAVDLGPRDALAGDAVEDRGRGRFRIRTGPEAGSIRVSITACGEVRTLRWLNAGPRNALPADSDWGASGAAPQTVAYAAPILLRVGDALIDRAPETTGGAPETWSVDPALPPGLVLDPLTGILEGVPTSAAATATHTVTAWNPHGSAAVDVTVQVTPALPPEVVALVDGFAVEALVADADIPVKLARLPDGRLLYNELATGQVRIVQTDGTLTPAPVATLDIRAVGEQGLLGLAVAPDFATTGRVYVFATTAGDGEKPLRNRVLRLTLAGDTATGPPEVIVDDLPVGTIHNAGDLQFGPDGRLYVSVGDTGNESLAQAEGLEGRILRYAADGSVPADNPDPASPEWVRGLRNSFDMAFHPDHGGLFASENGPTFGDELNYIQPGRNYGWPELPDGIPGQQIGFAVTDWTPVIAPTGLAFHTGAGWGSDFADDVFLGAYDNAELRRIELSGSAATDLDRETVFARWSDDGGFGNKPLDVLVEPDGSVLVSTFDAIWRIRRYP